jgi:hypothetical protein
MTNSLTDHRTILKDLLVAGGLEHTFVIVPPKATPPMVFVGPGSPYITYEGATFGGVIAHFDVGIVAGKGTNETAAEELDEMVLEVLDAIRAAGTFQANDVDRPGRINLNGQEHLACSIDVQTEIHR